MRKNHYPTLSVRKRAVTAFTALVLILAAAFGALSDYKERQRAVELVSRTGGLFAAHFIDVGQGDATLLASPDGQYMLIDCGPADSAAYLLKYLTDAGVEALEYLVLTHPHEDHYGGAEQVIRNFPVEHFMILEDFAETYPYDRLIYMIENNAFGEKTEIDKVKRDDSFTFAECAPFRVLSPGSADFDDYNESSLALKLIFGNTTFLFTGDAEKSSEKAMIAQGYDLRADVFQAGHHGSATSNTAAFVQAVSPEFAVISCASGNSYGHPHQSTLDTFEANDVRVLRTDLSGDIVMVSDGERVWQLTAEDSENAEDAGGAATRRAA